MTSTDPTRKLPHFESVLAGAISGEAEFTAPYWLHHSLLPSRRFVVIGRDTGEVVLEGQYSPGRYIRVELPAT